MFLFPVPTKNVQGTTRSSLYVVPKQAWVRQDLCRWQGLLLVNSLCWTLLPGEILRHRKQKYRQHLIPNTTRLCPCSIYQYPHAKEGHATCSRQARCDTIRYLLPSETFLQHLVYPCMTILNTLSPFQLSIQTRFYFNGISKSEAVR